MQAQTEILCCFDNDHPLVAKYNQFLIEVFNLKKETTERTLEIIQICQKNVKIA